MLVWNKRAETSLEIIILYIKKHFTQKEEDVFILQVLETLTQINEFPKAFPESRLLKGTRKAVIHPHTTLFYRIEKKNIRLFLFWDNRTNPKKLK
jgi:plasmid stabilization system protein ParE